MGPIYACNPCGEQQLHFNNSCNLGSIDVAKFYTKDDRWRAAVIDWERLSNVTQLCTQFLDNVVDAGHFPLPEIDDVVKRTRPVGLGIMGFADLCLKLGVTYGSDDSIDSDGKSDGLCPPRSVAGVASSRAGKRRVSRTRSKPRAYATIYLRRDRHSARHSADAAKLRGDDDRSDRHDLARRRNFVGHRAKFLVGIRPSGHARHANLRSHARRRGSWASMSIRPTKNRSRPPPNTWSNTNTNCRLISSRR